VSRTHDLKCHPIPFAAVRSGAKPYEIRHNDRDYEVGDSLLLREWDPTTGLYTGAFVLRLVTYMTPSGEWGLPEDLCVLGIPPVVVS
jgi:hypothetical protein